MKYSSDSTEVDCVILVDGNPKDAAVRAFQSGEMFGLILESRSGGRKGPRARNPDYLPALHLILKRLTLMSAVIESIEIVSRFALTLPEIERMLPMRFPICLGPKTNVEALRLNITEVQRGTARTPSARDGAGGNNNKRIKLVVRVAREHAGSLKEFTQAIGHG